MTVALLTTLVTLDVVAEEDGFLRQGRRGHRSESESETEFRDAMETMQGCGAEVVKRRLASVEDSLRPMWKVLPKNRYEMVDWKMVRYVAHRYFMQKSNLMIRGFEPMHRIDGTNLGTADIFSKATVDKVVQAKHFSMGFDLTDAVYMVATLEQLIGNAETTLLQITYKQQRQSEHQSLNHIQMTNLVEAYMIHWMMDDDHVIQALLRNNTLLHQVIPKWSEIKFFVDGLVRGMEYTRQMAPLMGGSDAALSGRFSFTDAQEVVSSITNRFASFWEGECQLIKASLVSLDKTGTGRVSLSDFYGANTDGDWHFAESEAYLRELGALDESSVWRGKQVIISNYMQGANNCIVSTPHYLVCCAHECEEVLNEIEDAVGGPSAAAVDILSVVSNMTDLTDMPPTFERALSKQLHRIAETHIGNVPLHGRLFAQWLHYLFPRECPFPHRTGIATALTPSQFGDNCLATQGEVSSHAAARSTNNTHQLEYEEAQMMSQWSEEEELIADYSINVRAPMRGSGSTIIGGVALVGLCIVAMTAVTGREITFSNSDQKVHCV